MTDKKPRKEKLNIYLIKERINSIDKILDLEKLRQPYELTVKNCKASLYGKNEVREDYPEWASFLTSTNLNVDALPNVIDKKKSTGAILLLKYKKRIFLITFGVIAHAINMINIERDFGLRVTLNSVDPTKLRSLDKASYSHNPLNSRNQSALETDIFSLEMDAESNLIYALTGASKENVFGSIITGRDALVLKADTSLNELHLVLNKALSQYKSNLPKAFEWIDDIKKIKDEDILLQLEKELDKELAKKDPNAYIGEPEVVDWENQIGYSFSLVPKSPRHLVLSLEKLKLHIEGQKKPFNCESIKKTQLHVNDSNYKSYISWDCFRCIYAEVILNGKNYILKNGFWYQVSSSFVNRIDDAISTIETYTPKLLTYDHDAEGDYNEDLANSGVEFFKLDKNLIYYGGGKSSIEFCDVIKNKTDFIHVKYYRGSQTLSHLFFQGSVAAEVFASDELFRKKLNEKLPNDLKVIVNQRPECSNYTIVFAIAGPKKSVKELPFFAKVSLKNSFKNILGHGFKVAIIFIETTDDIILKKKYKPTKAKTA